MPAADTSADTLTPIARDMLETCVAGRVRQISRVVSARYDDALRDHGVTANQLTILCLFAVLGPSRSVDIEPYLASEQSTLSRNLARMIDKSWVRKTGDADGRAHRLALTPKGKRVIEAVHGDWQDAQDWARKLLGNPGIESLHRVAKSLNPLIP